jgi:hypothetical protein
LLSLHFSLKFLNIYVEKKIAETEWNPQCQKLIETKIFIPSKVSQNYFIVSWKKGFVSYNCKFSSTTVDFVLFVSYNCSTTVLYKSTRFYNCTTNFTTVTFCNNWLATLARLTDPLKLMHPVARPDISVSEANLFNKIWHNYLSYSPKYSQKIQTLKNTPIFHILKPKPSSSTFQRF